MGGSSAVLGRQRRVSFRHFRYDRRRRNLTLALAQPLAGFLPAFLGLPMSGISGFVREDEFGGLEHGYLLHSITTSRQPPFHPRRAKMKRRPILAGARRSPRSRSRKWVVPMPVMCDGKLPVNRARAGNQPLSQNSEGETRTARPAPGSVKIPFNYGA